MIDNPIKQKLTRLSTATPLSALRQSIKSSPTKKITIIDHQRENMLIRIFSKQIHVVPFIKLIRDDDY